MTGGTNSENVRNRTPTGRFTPLGRFSTNSNQAPSRTIQSLVRAELCGSAAKGCGRVCISRQRCPLQSFSWLRTRPSSGALLPTVCGKRAIPLSRPRVAKKPSLCASLICQSTLSSPISTLSGPRAGGMLLNVFERIARTFLCFIRRGNRLIMDVAFRAVLFSPSHISITTL